MNKIDKKKLEDLLQEREQLLTLRPHLHLLQFEIEKRLLEADDDPIKRMLLMNRMLVEQVNQAFLPALDSLAKVNKRMKEKLHKLQNQESSYNGRNEEGPKVRKNQLDQDLS